MVRNCAPAPLKMETTFYDESYHNVNHLKRNMTLDLNSARSPLKRNKYGTPMLSTPDLNKLIPTPELEKLIAAPGTDILFPQAPTEEQELYARGFEDALNQLHHNSDSSQAADMHGPLSGRTYTNLDLPQGYQPSLPFGAEGVIIKDEPQTVPSIGSSPPLSPIDMECQEKIKLERKRQRNRVAASKCRRRKLERISRLEDKVKLLKGENNELSTVVFKLKEHVCLLKEQVMEHVQSGCAIMPSSTF